MDALVLQLTNTFQHKCRIYLHQCLEEFSHRYEAFQRETMETILKDCISAAHRLPKNNIEKAKKRKVESSPTPSSNTPDKTKERKKPSRVLTPSSNSSKVSARRLVSRSTNKTPTTNSGRPQRRCVAQSTSPTDADRIYDFALPSDEEEEEKKEKERESPAKRRKLVKPKEKVKVIKVKKENIVTKAKQKKDEKEKKERRKRREEKEEGDMREAVSTVVGKNPNLSPSQIRVELSRLLPSRPMPSPARLTLLLRGLFFTRPPSVIHDKASPAPRLYAHWFLSLACRLPRLLYLDLCLFNVRGRKRGRGQEMALLLAISPQAGLEQHAVVSAPLTDRQLETFLRRLVSGLAPGSCALVLGDKLGEKVETVRTMSGDHCVQPVPPSPPSSPLSPLPPAMQAWRGAMMERVSLPGVRSLILDVGEAANSARETADQLRAAILTEHAEAALNILSQEKVVRWHEAARRHLIAMLVDG